MNSGYFVLSENLVSNDDNAGESQIFDPTIDLTLTPLDSGRPPSCTALYSKLIESVRVSSRINDRAKSLGSE